MTGPHYQDDLVTIHHGDCLDVLRTLPDASVDAVVTDPPYGISFMGKQWDQPGQFGSTKRIGNPGIHGRDAGRESTGDTGAMEAGRYDLSLSAMQNFQGWCEQWATECLRVLKPGGHMLAFGGSRTWHRLAAAVEDAGFEIRDSIAWLYGSGFPKSHDVAQAIDKLDAADERLGRAHEFQAWMAEHLTAKRVDELTGTYMGYHLTTHPTQPSVATAELFDMLRPHLPDVPERIEELVSERTVESANYAAREVVGQHRSAIARGAAGVTASGTGKERTASLTEDAKRWEGWGTALKPAFEPIVVGRKPLAGTVAANVLAHGTGALNIAATRIPTDDDLNGGAYTERGTVSGSLNSSGMNVVGAKAHGEFEQPSGRWPTNVVLDGSQADALDEQTGELPSGTMRSGQRVQSSGGDIYGKRGGDVTSGTTYGGSGGASRFFPTFRYEAKAPSSERPKVGEVQHPTVKPLDLMRWLVRLVTPPNGVVLEPFAGSGTTIEAALLEGFRCIAIEREADYLPLIEKRITKPLQQSLFDNWGGEA